MPLATGYEAKGTDSQSPGRRRKCLDDEWALSGVKGRENQGRTGGTVNGIREVSSLNIWVCDVSGASKQRTECCFLQLRGEASARTVKLGLIYLQF